jgi:VIT1/CCC1 family predicted Fe2+/Mn2+ transporter
MLKMFKTGLSFGLTSATITTLGLMIGLYSSTNSKSVVLGGILLIAIADAFSDALGIHIAEESKDNAIEKEVWAATFYTFISKFFFALTYAVPFIFLEIQPAVIVSVVWGYFLLSALSFMIARDAQEKPLGIISEHIFIATAVIALTHFTGLWIANHFPG